jgi:hypothetical protein
VFSGHVLESLLLRSVCPRHEIVDLTAGMHVDDFGQNICDVGLRIDAVEFARLDERRDDRPVLTAAVRACKKSVLAVERDRSDDALNDVVVDLDAAVVEEAGKTIPSGQGVADRLGEFCLLADQRRFD